MGLEVSNKSLRFAKVRPVKNPQRGTPGSAGIDFFVPDDYPESLCSVDPGGRYLIPSGIKANIPNGYALIAMNKSGVSLKKDLIVGACVVDSDYQGEIHLHLINTGKYTVTISPGEKLVQFLLIPVSHANFLITTEEKLYFKTTTRGDGGFGSTGKA